MTLKYFNIRTYLMSLGAFCSLLCACSKNSTGDNAVYKLSYSDPVLYPLGETSELQTISPSIAANGTYTSFPEGLVMNNSTGVINLHESETGINYRIYYTSADSKTKDSTFITIAGINYLDGVYKINTADSVINPVYNAIIGNSLPNAANGSVFDEDGGCNSNGCAVNTGDAKINLAQTVRNGTFGSTPTNGDNKEFTFKFRVNDKSKKGGNKLKIKIFYFKKLADITPQVWDLLNGRNGTVINSFSNSNNTTIQGNTAGNIVENSLTGKGRRPPCVVILSQ
jgi:hypothetical protein